MLAKAAASLLSFHAGSRSICSAAAMKQKDTSKLLESLRRLMAENSLAGYIVPSEDAHQSEYIADTDCRRAFVSGFTGSAGCAIVTAEKAALYTDGRYFAQAAEELDGNWQLMRDGLPETPTQVKWLRQTLSSGDHVGVDPHLMSAAAFRDMSYGLDEKNIKLVAVMSNLVDRVWGANKPPSPKAEIFLHDAMYAGQEVSSKLAQIAKHLDEASCGCLVLTALDEIAWTFNLRGSDIMCNPVFFAYGIVTQKESFLFVDSSRFAEGVNEHLEEAGVQILAYKDFLPFLGSNVKRLCDGRGVWHGPTCSEAVLTQLQSVAKRVDKFTPPQTAKAVKNSVELEGMRNCHVRDAVALVEFFKSLEDDFAENPARQDITEVVAAERLDALRAEQVDFVSLSFPTISGSGPNAAVIHYHAVPDGCGILTTDQIYLCDSGAQFRDGTTDGRSLDAFARQHLWAAGLDYRHGTGHGVGSFLNVHEGPIGISTRTKAAVEPLRKGNVVSNEPGYYETGAFGIRIENLVEVVEAQCPNNFSDVGFLTFSALTLFPIQAKLIAMDLLTAAEVGWLDAYHTRCRETVGAELRRQGRLEALQWLEQQTRPLAEMV